MFLLGAVAIPFGAGAQDVTCVDVGHRDVTYVAAACTHDSPGSLCAEGAAGSTGSYVWAADWTVGAGGYRACPSAGEHGGIIVYGDSQEFLGEFTHVQAGWRYSHHQGAETCTLGAVVYRDGATMAGVPCPAGVSPPNPGWGSLLP